MFCKIDVNGKMKLPLYKFLKSNKKGILGTENIKMNFYKVLVDKEGNIVDRFAPTSTPESIEKRLSNFKIRGFKIENFISNIQTISYMTSWEMVTVLLSITYLL